jgi:hypothetical protein
MEIQEFPVGKKNFKIDLNGHIKSIELLTKKDLYNKVEELSKIVLGLEENFGNTPYLKSLRSSLRYTENISLTGSVDGVPTYTLNNANALSSQYDSVYTTKVARATAYQRTKQFSMLGNLPSFKGMVISFHEDKLTLHNMPYEGPLVNSDKYKEVNKLITTRMKELSAKIKLTFMLANDYMDIPKNDGNGSYYSSKEISSEQLIPYFVRYMQGTATLADELLLANATGILGSIGRRVNGSYKSVFEMKSRIPTFPTGIRTRLYYMMGATTLPDDYLEWFDA